jgi:hypothetical protein
VGAVKAPTSPGSKLLGYHLDGLGLDLFGLGQLQGQDAMLEGGLHLVGVEAGRQSDLPAEVAIAALLAQVVALLRLLFRLELAKERELWLIS